MGRFQFLGQSGYLLSPEDSKGKAMNYVNHPVHSLIRKPNFIYKHMYFFYLPYPMTKSFLTDQKNDTSATCEIEIN